MSEQMRNLLLFASVCLSCCSGRMVDAMPVPTCDDWATVSDRSLLDAMQLLARDLRGIEFVGIGKVNGARVGYRHALFEHSTTGVRFVFVPAAGSAELARVGLPMGNAVPFLLAETEITVDQYARGCSVIADNELEPFPGLWEDGDFPVDGVRWIDADSFCRALGWRLPTEAEWEWACTQGLVGLQSGARNRVLTAGFAGTWSEDGPWAVSTLPANALGLRGMHGSLWEWCSDLIADQGWPDHRVNKGGAFDSSPVDCRFRDLDREKANLNTIGFRPCIHIGP